MVSQHRPLTKPLATKVYRFFAGMPGVRAGLALSLLSCLGLGMGLPAAAMVKMEPKTIDAALVYGMKNQKAGLVDVLGPNWIEGENGSLLNVYSPFMMLATKASRAGLAKNPSKSDLEKARKRFAKDVAYYSDPKNRFQVKFSVSFYGSTPTFAKEYMAKIVGFGRGKEAEFKTVKQLLDQEADQISGGQGGYNYEAINAYYFNFSDLENLQDFKLILESPNGPPLEFRMRNERLY